VRQTGGRKYMPKYGRGLNREVVGAVNKGSILEPFTTREVRGLIKEKGWRPEPPEAYIVVSLGNGASENHSFTYKKYFVSVGEGLYRLCAKYKGMEWE